MRHQIAAHTGFSVKFQSTHSLRSATPRSPLHPRIPGFQSTHSLRSATARTRAQVMSMRGVSIHALLAECDMNPYHEFAWNSVSIHALLAECDLMLPGLAYRCRSFNPRTPCGVRLHSPPSTSALCQFQSTHSLRSATVRSCPRRLRSHVSIHALLAECDLVMVSAYRTRDSFNPRTPCGVRLGGQPRSVGDSKFQSTHSLRSATFFIHRYYLTPAVSIHALLAECDPLHKRNGRRPRSFNPRTPCGVRRL